MMKNLSLLLIILLISSSFAMDATRVPTSIPFDPNLDVYDIIEANMDVIESNADDAFELATEAEGLSAGTQKSMLEEDSCLYDTGIKCTADNIKYTFNTERWEAIDTESTSGTLDLPAHVRTIYVTLRSPKGSYFIYDESDTIIESVDPMGQTKISNRPGEGDLSIIAPASDTSYSGHSVTVTTDGVDVTTIKDDYVNLDISAPILKTSYTLDHQFPTLLINVPAHNKGGDYTDGFAEIKY